jgi:predicted TIM-barrel fold metal-dependent hydrolase
VTNPTEPQPIEPEPIEVVDAQIHLLDPSHCRAAARNSSAPDAGAPVPTGARPGQVLIEPVAAPDMVAAMDAAGVDAALAVNSSFYGWDNSYALAAARRLPDRFRVVGLLDPFAADVEESVERWSVLKGAAGMRVVIANPAHVQALDEGVFDRYFGMAERREVPVCVFASGHLHAVAAIARRHPNLQLVVDHFGLGVRLAGDEPVDVVSALPEVLALAAWPNVALKLTGGPCLSTEDFPFLDLGPLLEQLVSAYGPPRLLWGTDWVRVPNATYAQGVRYLLDSDRVGPSDKAWIMGRSVRTIFRWPKPPASTG